MEQELAYPAPARLNYWAVVDYWDEAPGMSVALNRYLAAKDKRGIRYCLVEESGCEGHDRDRMRRRVRLSSRRQLQHDTADLCRAIACVNRILRDKKA